MFESSLSGDCGIFQHGRSNKNLGTSDHCRHKAILRVLQSLLCKVLLAFDNSRLIDNALVFLASCKLRPGWHPSFCYLARSHLISYFCLLFLDKSAHFLTKNLVSK